MLSAGNYSVTITDNNGCVQTASTVVGQPSPLNILLNSIPVACYGGNDGSASAIVSGGVTGYTYQWSPSGGNTDIAINRTSRNYRVVEHHFILINGHRQVEQMPMQHRWQQEIIL
ncbi:MAG: SprB repeat-containing protein [Bacteroidetes bacterium]|nr:SprB repeat-containing protein [Bacteroidota bacterium]